MRSEASECLQRMNRWSWGCSSGERTRTADFMVGGVALVLAVNIFVIIELGYLFLGSVAVGPSRFVEVVSHLQAFRH
jgi:hypothetical protein